MQARKRYEERLLEDMASPSWQLSVGDAPPILRLPLELLNYIVEILMGDREGDNMKAVRSLRWRFAQITSPLVLSCISIVVKPSRLPIGLFWLARNPCIQDWCTTLHVMLQNAHHFVGAADSTALQDSLQSQIITLLPRLTTLRIRVKLYVYPGAMYDQTVAALASLKHIEDISFTTDSEYTTYSTQVLRIFAPSIRTLSIDGGDANWFIGDGAFFESHPRTTFRPWSFPNLQSLELRGVLGEEIHAQIPFDTPLVTLGLSFNTILMAPTASSLSRRRVQRLVLWVCTARIPPRPRFKHGPSADVLDLMVPIISTKNLPLITTFESLAEFVCSLPSGITRKVMWKVECSTPQLRTEVKAELQKPSVIAIFQSLAAACHDQRLQWELEGP